jgi:predicted DNA-binding transcriptional regulator YafY
MVGNKVAYRQGNTVAYIMEASPPAPPEGIPMLARYRRFTARLIAAARTIAPALVSATRGRAFRLIADLYRAIDNAQAVAITYVKADGARSERVIEPQALTVSAVGNILLRAYDHRDGEDTTFRTDRIETAQRCA